MDDDGGRIHPPPTLRLEVGVFCYVMINKSQVMQKIGKLPYDLMAAVDVGVLIELGLHREERKFA